MSKETVEILTENEQALEECVRIYLLLFFEKMYGRQFEELSLVTPAVHPRT